ncbi:MAG: type II secretion system protein [Cyanobacteria bacterium P01_E01_bin.6]
MASTPNLEPMKNQAFQKSSDDGFSLLEVLAVVVIIGVLAAIAAPGWVSFANRQRARDAKDQLQQAIRTTQVDAKRLRRRRSIQFYDVANSTANGVPQIELNESGIRETIGRGELPGGLLELTALDADGDAVPELVFRADGSLSVEANDYDVAPPTLPVTISFSVPNGGNLQRCIRIETLLASIDSAKDNDCN